MWVGLNLYDRSDWVVIRNIFTIQIFFFNTLESSVTKSSTSLPKESLITKSIVRYLPWHHATYTLPERSSRIKGSLAYPTYWIATMPIDSVIRDPSRILLTHRIVTMPIDFVIRDPSRVLLTHQIVTMPIDSVIRDLSCILLTHQIIPTLIDFIIRDLSRDVTHPLDPSVWKTDGLGPPLPRQWITLDST